MGVKEKEKQLIKNTGILALGTLASKVFSFFLLPLYTTALSTSDYGIVDVLQSVTSVMLPFITLQLSSAVFRFIIEKNEEKGKSVVISTGFGIEGVNLAVTSGIIILINSLHPISYCTLFILYYISLASLEFCQNVLRGFGRNGIYSLISFVMTVVSVVSNIVMIVLLHMKGDSILIASILSYSVASLIAAISLKLWRYINVKSISMGVLKEMLKYSVPLIPNAISWWIANTSDRLLIRFFLGASFNGIYAAANKIPTIYTTIFNVYNIAWIESLSRSANDRDQEEFINEMFAKSIKLFGCICLGIISCVGLIFELLIGKAYVDAYLHIFILMTAIFFNSVCSLLGGVFTSFKKTEVIGRTTVYGAIVNFAVNIIFIRFIGLYAASISTLVSYVIIMVVRLDNLKGLISIRWPRRYLIQLISLYLISSVVYFLKYKIVILLWVLVLILWSLLVNKDSLIYIINMISSRIKKNRG